MLLFQKRFHAGLLDGSVSLTFRRWQKPHVRVGGRYRVHPIGVVEVSAVEQIALVKISAADLRAAGFVDLAELVSWLEAPVKVRGGGVVVRDKVAHDTLLYRVAMVHAGQDDRVDGALNDALSADEVATLFTRLQRLDANGEWTKKTLALIGRYPEVAASKLARKVGRETEPFKVDVRKLKRLGLTMSFEVGYRISPRGLAYLKAKKPRAPRAPKAPAKKKPRSR